jgi:pimeloyl-ACP methyl ester carboxylesterase
VTLFVDLRATATGGVVAGDASLWDGGSIPLPSERFGALVQGRDVLLATHGFNVNREHGINALSRWGELLSPPPSVLFVGVLWPGDSAFLPVVDYPFEGQEAIQAGRLLARFLAQHAGQAASLSFVSHSLGARVVLEAIQSLPVKVRRVTLMAGAIEDDCFAREYKAAADNCEQLWTLASREDWVLKFAFPIGNVAGEVIMRGHPYFSAAIGRGGPSQPLPLEKRGGSWQIPDGWHFGHGDYLPSQADGTRLEASSIQPLLPPASDAAAPEDLQPPWKPSWSAAAVSDQEL